MCLFGGNKSTPAAEVPDEPSDQSEPQRDDSMTSSAQSARDPLGRSAKNSAGRTFKSRRTRRGGGTLLTAQAEDATAKKTLLGA